MPDSPRWISTSEAAKSLGVNSRAVQKRAARGSIAARKVGNQWEIDVDAMDASTGPKVDVMDASNGRIADATDASDVQGVDAKDASTGLTGRVHVDAMDAVADLRDEVMFLRGLIEQRDRDAAELRASLREALRAMPKQLGAGDAPAMPQPTPTAPPGAQESGVVSNQGAANVESSTRAPGAQQSGAFDYGAICDRLESDLLKKRQT